MWRPNEIWQIQSFGWTCFNKIRLHELPIWREITDILYKIILLVVIFSVVYIKTSQQIFLINSKLEKVYTQIWKSNEIPVCSVSKSLGNPSEISEDDLIISAFFKKSITEITERYCLLRFLWMPFWLMQPCTESKDFHLSYTVLSLLLEQNQYCFRANVKLDKKIMLLPPLLPSIESYLKTCALLKSTVDELKQY